MRLLRIAAVVAAWFLFVAVVAWYLAAGAQAHHAPSGWAYPPACCAAVDCFPLQPGDVERTAEG